MTWATTRTKTKSKLGDFEFSGALNALDENEARCSFDTEFFLAGLLDIGGGERDVVGDEDVAEEAFVLHPDLGLDDAGQSHEELVDGPGVRGRVFFPEGEFHDYCHMIDVGQFVASL